MSGVANLWGADLPVQTEGVKKTKDTIKKIKTPKKVTSEKSVSIKSKKLSIPERLTIINENVDKVLGVYKDTTVVIKSKQELEDYINTAVKNNVIAVDTETNNSLDPLTCKLMGLCLYTTGLKSAYVPVNHTDLDDNRFDWQVTEEDVREALEKIKDIEVLTHNGKFDYQVIYCTCGIKIPITWDSMTGARILNENERSAGLKQQYIDKIDSSIEKYSIDELFTAIEYKYVDPEVFALYAATDSYMTYKLYEYQKQQFELPENRKLYDLYKNLEVPIVTVVAEMELEGISIDKEYSKLLSKKYHDKLTVVEANIDRELRNYTTQINEWRLTDEANFAPTNKNGTGVGKSKAQQLEEPVNVTSPTQLAILLYDVLKVPPKSKKSPRGTGEDILKKINLPICDLILEQRGLLKLINTYIDKLPECVSERDNRLHAQFNPVGPATGRLSSNNPNLQNIPSHNKEIRMMFAPRPGYVFVGSDYSAQEVRLLAEYCKDENMINTYKEGKDLYSSVASIVYNNKYEENREFWEDGTPNPAGKKRRSSVKSIVLGLMYGRGVNAIAEQIKDHDGPTTRADVQEAQDITDKFFGSFPKVKQWMDETQAFAYKNGYVEDLWGRRRRLPDLQLPKYEIKNTKAKQSFNPLLHTSGLDTTYSDSIIQESLKRLNSCKYKKEVDDVKSELISKGFTVKDNGGFIAQAERQSVNARVQGAAASLSKQAMVDIYNDKELRDLGFTLQLAVHDELIGECPQENADKVADRLTYIMVEAAKGHCEVPMKCDATIEGCWYETDYVDNLKDEYDKLVAQDKDTAYDIIKQRHSELTEERLKKYLYN